MKKVPKKKRKKPIPQKMEKKSDNAAEKVSQKVSRKVSAKNNSFKKMASKITRSTKKIVDDVLLKLIGTRVLERAQEVSATLTRDKSRSKKAKEE